MRIIILVLAILMSVFGCVTVQFQSSVIQRQRSLINEMVKNPACTQPVLPTSSDN